MTINRKRALLSILPALALLFICKSSAQAKVTLARIFSDGAVFQKDKPINVWGEALPGEVVTVDMAIGRAQTVVDKSGKFLVTLPAMSFTEPLEMTITGQNKIVLKNIRLGQVFLVAGDGIMHASLQEEAALEKKYGSGELAEGNIEMPDGIRLYRQPISLSRNPDTIGNTGDERTGTKGWVNINKNQGEALKASAIGMILARELKRNLKEPIGIIQVTLPDTPLRSWISAQSLDSVPEARSIAQKNMLDEDIYKRDWQEYINRTELEKLPSKNLSQMTSAVANGMLAPITPYGLKAVIFAQGESDLAAPLQYKTLFPVFIKDLRRTFAQEQLPLYYVQLGAQPTETAEKENASQSASIRHTQFKARIAPKSYLIVSSDICHEDEKSGSIYMSAEDLSKRIANTALATLFKQAKAYLYPIVEYIEVEGNAVKVVFKNAGRGLMAKGKPPVKGFALAGHDHQFFEAEAKIEGNTVFLESKYVRQPKFVRYGWGNNPKLTLFSLDGLPAMPYTNDR